MSKKGKKAKAARPQAAQMTKTAEQSTPKATKSAATPFNWPIVNDEMWKKYAYVITALAAFLRVVVLELRPLHHDEGVNGFFLTNLMRDGLYKYQPDNYHGPSLYYIAAPFVEFFGFNTYPIRMTTAIFGFLLVVLALCLRRYLGNIGSLVGALFLAIGPGMLFISRYFIHEIFFIFFSLSLVVAVLYYLEKRRAGTGAVAWMYLILWVCLVPTALLTANWLGGESKTAVWAIRIALFAVDLFIVHYIVLWLRSIDEGRPIYLMLAAVSVAMQFATKETAFITIGTMIISVGCVWLWKRIKPGGVLKKDWFSIVLGIHLILIAAGIYFRDTLADGWAFMSETYLSGRFAPPENFAFALIIFLFIGAIAVWAVFLNDLRNSNESEISEPADLTFSTFRSSLGERSTMIVAIAGSVILFTYLLAEFFSSFFTYADGIWKMFEAYAIWTKTGGKEHAQNGYFAFFKWGMKIESPLLVLSVLGGLIAVLKRKHRFAMFTTFWALGLFIAYTIIPYKTPWLALSYLLPMSLIAGYGINELYSSRDTRQKFLAAVLLIIGTVLLGYQSYIHNFVAYDDDKMPYVYAHTRRGFLGLTERLDYYAAKSGKGADSTIEIVSPDYWPMTWYTLKFNHANYHGRIIDSTNAEFIVAKKRDQDAEVMKKYADKYKYVGMYPLRPGVDLNLLVRRDIADPDTQELSVIPTVPMTP